MMCGLCKWFDRRPFQEKGLSREHIKLRLARDESELRLLNNKTARIKERINRTGRASEHDLFEISRLHRRLDALLAQMEADEALLKRAMSVFYA